MIPDWAHRITLADLVIAVVFLSGIVAAIAATYRNLRRFLTRIEAKAQQAAFNTGPNHGHSPHDKIMGRFDSLDQRLVFLEQELSKNHPSTRFPDDNLQ